MTARACVMCGGSLEGMRRDAKVCSNRCKVRQRRGRPPGGDVREGRQCEVCAASMGEKRLDARWCSKKCRDVAWYTANQEELKARSRRWHADNPGRAAESHRAWIKENPEKARAHRQARRARERNAPGAGMTGDQWFDMIAELDECCAYCGETTTEPHVEHVVPLVRGGWHDVSNIVPACPTCNLRKNAKTGPEFVPGWVPPAWIVLRAPLTNSVLDERVSP